MVIGQGGKEMVAAILRSKMKKGQMVHQHIIPITQCSIKYNRFFLQHQRRNLVIQENIN